MNKSKLKAYAPEARRDFIQMIRQRADLLGLTKKEIAPATLEGEISVIEGRAYKNKNYAALHTKLAAKIRIEGAEQLIERVAYSWFNRFAALRFMEINNFLAHGFRVLSSRDEGKTEPEILTHAAEVDLSGLDKEKVIEFKLEGNRDAELYRMVLIAQCNELNRAMPFLFEKIGDETEILLPDNLLATDSVIRKLVSAIDEADWQEVEIIGWLYQFYISEKKDEVIGKTVKSEDIPAATQLFTPNWIVKYMTQNSLGRLWLESNPNSSLASQMDFYIKPKETIHETHEKTLNNTEENSFRDFSVISGQLNPEEIKILDPACGSGHILVEAYELLKAIYTERGFSSRDIPLLILQNNLFGLDIDERAVQMASFALLMKARNDDRRIFERIRERGLGGREKGLVEGSSTTSSLLTPNPFSLLPNIFVIPDSSELEYEPNGIAEMFFSDGANRGAVPIRDEKYMFSEMNPQPSLVQSPESNVQSPKNNEQRTTNNEQITEQNIIDLLELFENGKTYGSLIRIPHGFGAVVEGIARRVQTKAVSGDMNEQIAARQLIPFIQAAQILALKYDAVIANPPYMGGKGMNAALKDFAKREFPESKSDLFAMFVERNLELTKETGKLGFMTPFVWMFISSYEKLRDILINDATITTLVQLEYSGFAEATVPICTFTLAKKHDKNAVGSFVRLSDFRGHQNQAPKTLEAIQNPDCGWRFQASSDDFKKIPGSPIAYWVSDKVREVFEKGKPLGEIANAKSGMSTTDNDRFLRYWFEVNVSKVKFDATSLIDAKVSKCKWFPYNKGGGFRRWFGNNNYLINFKNDGEEIKFAVVNNPSDPKTTHWSRRIFNTEYFFKEGITWSTLSSSYSSFRYFSKGFIGDSKGASVFPKSKSSKLLIGFLNSSIVQNLLSILNPTLDFSVGAVNIMPLIESDNWNPKTVNELIEIARADWDSFETSWDFERFPILELCRNPHEVRVPNVLEENETEEHTYSVRVSASRTNSVEEAFRLWEELTEDRIGRMQELETENNRLFITAYGLEDELEPEVPLEQITLARADRTDDTKKLLSYFVGCGMGRYSLDTSGLVYADAGGVGFDHSNYQTFTADEDGIIPVTDMEWFPQEAVLRFEKFVDVAFGNDLTAKDAKDAKEENDNKEEENNFHHRGTEDTENLDNKEEEKNKKKTFATSATFAVENLAWIAEGIGKKANETPIEAIRRYFSKDFFKDHIKTYKKRPIYWLFSSGKQKAFECLVYLHRYNNQTLARMRHEYVLPLMSKLTGQIETIEKLIEQSETTSEANKLGKEREMLEKKRTELAVFDEKLRHYSDMKISLDLDDGVKENYGKFGDLLAEVNKIAKTS